MKTAFSKFPSCPLTLPRPRWVEPSASECMSPDKDNIHLMRIPVMKKRHPVIRLPFEHDGHIVVCGSRLWVLGAVEGQSTILSDIEHPQRVAQATT